MKIKVVSQNAERAEEMARHVRSSGPGLDVQAAASTLAGLPAVINGSKPGLLVLDEVDAAGLDALARMAQAYPEVDAIVISSEQSPAFLLRAMQAGVREVLPPPVTGPALQAAVQRLLRKRGPELALPRTATCSRSCRARAAAARVASPPTLRTCCRHATEGPPR